MTAALTATMGGLLVLVAPPSASAATFNVRDSGRRATDRPTTLPRSAGRSTRPTRPAEGSLTVTLAAGSNTIRATATTVNGGPNVDRITIG